MNWYIGGAQAYLSRGLTLFITLYNSLSFKISETVVLD